MAWLEVQARVVIGVLAVIPIFRMVDDKYDVLVDYVLNTWPYLKRSDRISGTAVDYDGAGLTSVDFIQDVFISGTMEEADKARNSESEVFQRLRY